MEIKNSSKIVREIWGSSDVVLFIFAGAAAEFSLNPAIDWLFFTGKLPNDPLGRLFSTLHYARAIIFEPSEKAAATIEKMRFIHQKVEESRGFKIPNEAYKDVLYLLIYYSIAAFELLNRKLTLSEKQDVFETFESVGKAMKISDLPENYSQWLTERKQFMETRLSKTNYTAQLYERYLQHLGLFRYQIMQQVQTLLLPKLLTKRLELPNNKYFYWVIFAYKFSKMFYLDYPMKALLLPKKYRKQVFAIDRKCPFH